MAVDRVVVARVKVDRSKAQLMSTFDELKHRLSPKTLASDAWHGVKDAGSAYATKGVDVASHRPGAVGGTIFAVALFFLRGPLARLLTGVFGSAQDKGRVTTTLSSNNDDYDLTAPVVPKS